MFTGRFHRERAKLALRLDEEIRASLSNDKIPPLNDALEEIFGEYSIGEFPETREMRFFLGDVKAFTPGLVSRLRRLVAGEFPKWTIVPQFEDCVFVVTATGVVFGDNWIRNPITTETPELQQWWAKAREVEETKLGPYQRQLNWLKPQILPALKKLPEEGIILLGIFERLQFEGRAGWILVLPDEIGHSSWKSLPETSSAGSYPVDAGGVIHPKSSRRFGGLDGEKPAAWLDVITITTTLPGSIEFYSIDKDVDARGSLIFKTGRLIKQVNLPKPVDDRTLPTV